MMANTFRTTLAAALLSLSFVTMAIAQDPAQQPMMGPGMHGMMGQGMGPRMMGPGMMMDSGPMVEGRLAYLKAELGITDKETEAWDGYASAVKSRAAGMRDMHAAMVKTMQTGNAVDRIRAHADAMQSMADSMKALIPATEALYGALSAEQKGKADQLLGSGCCMM
jgi:hypothetical protein